MTNSINRAELRGNVGQDPKITQVNELSVARFRMATNETYKDKKGELKEETIWHNIVAWGGKGIPEFKEIKKGVNLSVTGKIRNGKYKTESGEDRYFSEILANKIEVNPE